MTVSATLKISGQKRIASLPIYRAKKIEINGRDVTNRIRGFYDGEKIVLTRHALPGATRNHEIGHAIDKMKHGHISEADARKIGLQITGVNGPTNANKKEGLQHHSLGDRVYGFALKGRPHPPGCGCPYHLGHKKGKKPKAMRGIGSRSQYSFVKKTGMIDGKVHGFG